MSQRLVKIQNVKPVESHRHKGLIVRDNFTKVLLAVIDCSFSMDSGDKLKNAWHALKSDLTPRLEDYALGIIQFPAVTRKDTRWTEFPDDLVTDQETANWLLKPCKITSLDHLQEPHVVGDTPMHAGLNLGWIWLKKQVDIQARIMLFTDGEPTDKEKPDIIKAAVSHHIPIDTVGITNRYGRALDSGYDPLFLKRLSEATGGIFTEVDSQYSNLSNLMTALSPVERKALGTPQ